MDRERLEEILADGVFGRRELLRYGALLGLSLGGLTGCAGGGGALAAAGAGGRAAVGSDSPGGGGARAPQDGAEGAPAPGAGAPEASPAGARTREKTALARSPKRYPMKKSINLWAFPYPARMTLRECFELAKRAGFDAVEVNYNLEDDISPQAGPREFHAIRDTAEKIGIAISGVCSFLFWPYPFTANQEATRKRALELARKMIEAAHHLGTENLLVVPGAVYIPWLKDSEEVAYADADRRARAAVRALLPDAERYKVHLNIENIFFNGYLLSPRDMVEFVDSFESPWVHVHFDTGNIMPFQFPEHWIPILGKRIRNVHFKEYSKKSTDFTLEGFRPLLDGTTNWPAVLDALEAVGYRGYVTFEYFHPFPHYPEALVYQASDALDRMLGRGG